MKQGLYANGALSVTVKQGLYANGALGVTVKRSLYANGALGVTVKRGLYANAALSVTVKQGLCANGALTVTVKRSLHANCTPLNQHPYFISSLSDEYMALQFLFMKKATENENGYTDTSTVTQTVCFPYFKILEMILHCVFVLILVVRKVVIIGTRGVMSRVQPEFALAGPMIDRRKVVSQITCQKNWWKLLP